MTEMFGEAWSPMSVPDLAPDDDDDRLLNRPSLRNTNPRCESFPGMPHSVGIAVGRKTEH